MIMLMLFVFLAQACSVEREPEAPDSSLSQEELTCVSRANDARATHIASCGANTEGGCSTDSIFAVARKRKAECLRKY